MGEAVVVYTRPKFGPHFLGLTFLDTFRYFIK